MRQRIVRSHTRVTRSPPRDASNAITAAGRISGSTAHAPDARCSARAVEPGAVEARESAQRGAHATGARGCVRPARRQQAAPGALLQRRSRLWSVTGADPPSLRSDERWPWSAAGCAQFAWTPDFPVRFTPKQLPLRLELFSDLERDLHFVVIDVGGQAANRIHRGDHVGPWHRVVEVDEHHAVGRPLGDLLELGA